MMVILHAGEHTHSHSCMRSIDSEEEYVSQNARMLA